LATAYSYVRFSTEKQELGASLARQDQLAEKYAKDHNLTLSEQTYQDLGVSAFKGLNSSQGALSLFLKACNDKVIAKGSYLLVESLDRLSRQDVPTALRSFQDIIDKGIIIVTTNDGQVYSTASILKNWTQLVVALAVMARANEEIEEKTRRIRDGWAKKKAKALAGNVILTAKGPSWLKLVDGKWVPISDKVKAVQKVFELSLTGHGSPKIAKLMNERFKIPPLATAKFWTQSGVASVLASKAVIGVFQRRERPDEIIENYFPPIIKPETFYAVRERVVGRRRKAGIKGEVVNNLFSGLIYCPCGSKMRAVNSNKNNYYLRCLRAYANAGCDAPIVSYAPFEYGVLRDIQLVHQTPLDHPVVIHEEPSIAIRGEIRDKQEALERLRQAIEIGEREGVGELSVITKRIGQIGSEIKTLEKELLHAFKPTPVTSVLDQAFEMFDRHADLKIDGTLEELHDFRQRMYSTIHTLLNKIVIRTDIGEFDAPDYKTGGVYTWLSYEMHGPLVEVLRNNNSERHFTFAENGGWGNSYMVNKGSKNTKVVRRRAGRDVTAKVTKS
jgi:DNA invertase Pin-like site-specific DNA recombinase